VSNHYIAKTVISFPKTTIVAFVQKEPRRDNLKGFAFKDSNNNGVLDTADQKVSFYDDTSKGKTIGRRVEPYKGHPVFLSRVSAADVEQYGTITSRLFALAQKQRQDVKKVPELVAGASEGTCLSDTVLNFEPPLSLSTRPKKVRHSESLTVDPATCESAGVVIFNFHNALIPTQDNKIDISIENAQAISAEVFFGFYKALGVRNVRVITVSYVSKEASAEVVHAELK